MKLTGGEAITEQSYLDKLARQPDVRVMACGWCGKGGYCTPVIGRLPGGLVTQASHACDKCRSRYNLRGLGEAEFVQPITR